MNYKYIRDMSLQLINQYSQGGTLVPNSYNNQADYLMRIPFLVNDAQVYIATTAKKIHALAELETLDYDEKAGKRLYCVPQDFYKFRGSGLLDIATGVRYPVLGYVENRRFAVPPGCPPEALLEYYRYPSLLDDAPKDADELDNSTDAQMCIPYYVAAHLVLYDDAAAYAYLSNEFETRLARLSDGATFELGLVEDVYGFGGEVY